jgi:hypothetical protein
MIMSKVPSHNISYCDVMGKRKKNFLVSPLYLVFLLKNVANESKAIRSLLNVSDYELIQNKIIVCINNLRTRWLINFICQTSNERV